MSTKITIAIIGATGKMGSAIANNLAKENYRLILFSRNEEKARHLQKQIMEKNSDADIECSCCPYDASWEADIIIAAVPFTSEKEVAQKIKDVATQKIVISISNSLSKIDHELLTRSGNSGAEELQNLLPHSKLVKAFSKDFDERGNGGNQIDFFIAGNDIDALETVSELIKNAGFNPIITGDLFTAKVLETYSTKQQL